MTRLLSAATVAAMIWLSAAAGQTTKKAPVKKPASSTSKASPAKTSSTAKKGVTARKRTPAKKPAVTWRNRQSVPSPERYREIQSALVQRGYLSEQDANGTWNQASIDALRRFQTEQNIESSGKINSLSLIALGLGPKRESVVAPPKPQPEGQ